MADRKPTRVTNAEWMLLARNRHGRTQDQAAKLRGTSLFAYRKLEFMRSTDPKVFKVPLEEHETLWLKRVRCGLSMQKLAKQIGVSRFWLRKMEAGTAPLDRLREHWRTR